MKLRGMGRPAEYKDRIIFTTSMEKEVLERGKQQALKEGKPFNKLLEELLIDCIKKHGEGNPNYTLEQYSNGLLAYPTPWDPTSFDVHKLKAFDRKELLHMKRRLIESQAAIDSVLKLPEDRADLEQIHKRIAEIAEKRNHNEAVLKAIDRQLLDPKQNNYRDRLEKKRLEVIEQDRALAIEIRGLVQEIKFDEVKQIELA